MTTSVFCIILSAVLFAVALIVRIGGDDSFELLLLSVLWIIMSRVEALHEDRK